MDELKPCPFCGGHVDVTSHVTGTTWIRCSRCRAQIVGHTLDEAKAAWNTRAERTCTNEFHTDEYKRNFFRCSACGCKVMDYEDYRVAFWVPDGNSEWKYCPNCGAKVVSE